MHILHLVLLHLASYLRLRWFVNRVGDHMGYYSSSIGDEMGRIKGSVDRLFFIIGWISAHGEIALLRAEDLSIYVRRRHWFNPLSNRRLIDISEQDCFTWFSQSHNNMCRLMTHLCVPSTFMHNLNGTGGRSGKIIHNVGHSAWWRRWWVQKGLCNGTRQTTQVLECIADIKVPCIGKVILSAGVVNVATASTILLGS